MYWIICSVFVEMHVLKTTRQISSRFLFLKNYPNFGEKFNISSQNTGFNYWFRLNNAFKKVMHLLSFVYISSFVKKVITLVELSRKRWIIWIWNVNDGWYRRTISGVAGRRGDVLYTQFVRFLCEWNLKSKNIKYKVCV